MPAVRQRRSRRRGGGDRGGGGRGLAGRGGRRCRRGAPEDPGASRRFWFEHATGAGKTVAAVGFLGPPARAGDPDSHPPPEPRRPVHRRDLRRGSRTASRRRPRRNRPSWPGHRRDLPVVRPQRGTDLRRLLDRGLRRGQHQLGKKTSGCIRNWPGPVFIGMTATGALIARRVADLFPPRPRRFDLAQAARRGGSPLRCVRIPPGPGSGRSRRCRCARARWIRTSTREELAKLSTRRLPASRSRSLPGALPPGPKRRLHGGVKHANNVARRSRTPGSTPRRLGETPKRESSPRSSPASSAARSTSSARCLPRLEAELPGDDLHAPRGQPPRAGSTSSGSAGSRGEIPARSATWYSSDQRRDHDE